MGTIIRISTAGMSREDWLAERRHSLGGSDMGAVLGLNHYASPYTVWMDKTGRLPEREDNEAMRTGRDLEPYVASRFEEASGLKVRRGNYILRNTDCPQLHANVDRMIIGQKAGLECKTASALNEKSFTGGNFPDSYYAQCVAYLAVTEYERWYLAALVMGRGFFVYQMTRIENDQKPDWCESSVYVSDEEISAVRQTAAQFWTDYVEKDVAPEPDGMKATTEAIKARYPDAAEDEIDLTCVDLYVKRLAALQAEKKTLEANIDDAQNHIKEFMAEAGKGISAYGTVSWKNQSRRTFDTAAFAKDNPSVDLDKYYKTSESRVFKFTEKKGV